MVCCQIIIRDKVTINKGRLEEDKEANLVDNNNKEDLKDLISMMSIISMKLLDNEVDQTIIHLSTGRIWQKKNKGGTLIIITNKIIKNIHLVRPITFIEIKMEILVSVKHMATQTMVNSKNLQKQTLKSIKSSSKKNGINLNKKLNKCSISLIISIQMI